MDPQDFLKTANVLVDSLEESDSRTSVSRSYYAVILFYRNYFAKEVGFLPEKLEAIHTFVPQCFNESDPVEAKRIGEKISRLKQERTNADYILSKTVSSTKAKDCLGLAKELIDFPISNQTKSAVLSQATARAKARKLI